MINDFTRYSEILRNLCREYYYHNITFEEFKRRRGEILDGVERDVAGHGAGDVNNMKDIIGMFKSYVRKLNVIE